MQNQLLDMLMKDEEITWQTIILELVKSGELDPWNVDVSILTKRYLEAIKAMQEANLFISAKVLLASALLLKIKSELLLTEGMAALDNYLFPPEELEELDDFVGDRSKRIFLDVEPALTIKTPQTRKRRVTVEDLLGALEKALDINERRVLKRSKIDRALENFDVPEKAVDISTLILKLHRRILSWLEREKHLYFSHLVTTPGKKEKLYTFVPLLHLANQNAIELSQKEHFGDIHINLLSKDLNSQTD